MFKLLTGLSLFAVTVHDSIHWVREVRGLRRRWEFVLPSKDLEFHVATDGHDEVIVGLAGGQAAYAHMSGLDVRYIQLRRYVRAALARCRSA